MKVFRISFREVSILLPQSQLAVLLWGLETVTPNVLHLRSEAITWSMANIMSHMSFLFLVKWNRLLLTEDLFMIGQFSPISGALSLHLSRCFTFSNRWLSKYYFYFSCCCQFKCFLKIFGISFKELHGTAARHPGFLSCASYILAQSIMKYRLVHSTRNVNYFIYKNLLKSVKRSYACVRSPLHRWNIMKNYNKCILQKCQLYLYKPLVF